MRNIFICILFLFIIVFAIIFYSKKDDCKYNNQIKQADTWCDTQGGYLVMDTYCIKKEDFIIQTPMTSLRQNI